MTMTRLATRSIRQARTAIRTDTAASIMTSRRERIILEQDIMTRESAGS